MTMENMLVKYILCLLVLTAIFSSWTWISWYQSISILDFIGTKDDGDGC